MLGAIVALTAVLCVSGARAQPSPSDTTIDAIDTLVFEDLLVTIERTRCVAAQPFDRDECGELVARDLADAHTLWRTPVPFPLRGLIQLEPVGEGAARRLFLRAYELGAIFDGRGHAGAVFRVPPSTLEAPVGLRAASGALVLEEHGGCSAFVTGQSDPTHGLYVRGVESHVYQRLGEPHDTVCFGFSIHAIGEVRVGSRPGGRGRGGAIRHAVATRVLVAVTTLQHPVAVRAPSVIAFDGERVAYTTTVGAEGEVIASASLRGSHAIVVVSDGETRREITLDARSGQRVATRTLAAEETREDAASSSAATTPPSYDRRGLVVPAFERCRAERSGAHSRLLVEGHRVLASERTWLVLDQRGTRCVAVELGSGRTMDIVHLLSW